ncbi:MAG: hypothetical protein WBW73_04805 [Rhodoplanes sp.]
MLSDLWDFLVDPTNRTVLGWIGGGIVVVVGGIWAVVKFLFTRKREENAPVPRVSATHGGVAAGRDIRNSKIDTRGSAKE